jgi:tetratricopeptide (TPR) repeat protein
MDQGGYERAAGKEGAFRQFVKNADKQRELQESEAIVASESTEQRNLLRAKEQYEKNPKVPDSINVYAQLLKKQGTPQAEMLAYEIYMRGFKDTGEYRFKMAAGDIKVEQLRRDVESLDRKAQSNPTDAITQSQLSATRSVLINTELAELNERVSKYPTDRYLRMRLGEIEFASGNYEAAQLAFQAVKDEPKLRVRAAHMLGRCFAAESWHREAISEYKEALSAIDATEKDRELDIRYDLMVSLIEDARAERDVNLAKEALEICSGIVRKSISYRDIRAKRKEVDQLIRDLTGGDAAQA